MRFNENSRATVVGPETVLLERGKSERVFLSVTADGHGDIITAVFAFGAHDSGDPPDRWVIKEQSFHQALQQIH